MQGLQSETFESYITTLSECHWSRIDHLFTRLRYEDQIQKALDQQLTFEGGASQLKICSNYMPSNLNPYCKI